MVLGQDKKRLSKRNAVTSLQDYFDQGYLESSIINMLARIGWSKGDKEIFYLDDLVSDFRIQEVQKGFWQLLPSRHWMAFSAVILKKS